MEIATLVFPIVQVIRHNRAVHETSQALADFENKRRRGVDMSTDGSGSITAWSMGSKRSGKMYSMESLDECLRTNHDGLKIYASCVELNGENILFLGRVLAFQEHWSKAFSRDPTCARTRMLLFQAALNIYVSLVDTATATYPINIESPVYNDLHAIFGRATELVASTRRSSVQSSPISQVAPWEDEEVLDSSLASSKSDSELIHMHFMSSDCSAPKSGSDDSAEHIMPSNGACHLLDPLHGFPIPTEFDGLVFDAAFRSIKYMVWTETWQRYVEWRRSKESII